MNYPQEKYDEANLILASRGRTALTNADWDRALSIFATVPQVTIEQAREMFHLYFENHKRGRTLWDQDLLEAVNFVLAKRGPVIAVAPVDGMVSLEDVKRAAREVWHTWDALYGPKELADRICSRLTKLKTPEERVTEILVRAGLGVNAPMRAAEIIETLKKEGAK
jgi:hypothetical protein